MSVSLQTIPFNGPCASMPIMNSTYWQPECGAAWQIEIQNPLTNTANNASIYDIDLFDNSALTIKALHKLSRKVICYFSAGTYENWRSDASSFQKSDYAKAVGGWPGEFWLNTSSPNVRTIMSKRLDLAASKGCDGVDPDNIDGYDNDTGLDLDQDAAVDYLQFLAREAHARKISIGLKNGGAIVPRVVDIVQWDVNEQCSQYKECNLFTPFIKAGKPVFHIEYKKTASMCKNAGFSTIYKNLNLGDAAKYC